MGAGACRRSLLAATIGLDWSESLHRKSCRTCKSCFAKRQRGACSCAELNGTEGGRLLRYDLQSIMTSLKYPQNTQVSYMKGIIEEKRVKWSDYAPIMVDTLPFYIKAKQGAPVSHQCCADTPMMHAWLMQCRRSHLVCRHEFPSSMVQDVHRA